MLTTANPPEGTDQTAECLGCPLIEGGLYEYIHDLPKGCAGHHYRLHRLVKDVPSYQEKVLVEALTGKDKGLWFVCSEANFAIRYKLKERPLR